MNRYESISRSALSPAYRKCNGSINRRYCQCFLCKGVLHPELICLSSLDTDVLFGDITSLPEV
ncbi:hypothetical protein J6590_080644 [Homalodisca vitripennis]|nr:hypothetical protein J6590_080644 [Homalodisca vitripennis]